MSEKAPNQNVTMVRNIIVGVSTSVIGAASLYFLGINKSGSSSSTQGTTIEIKEATTKGWKSYMASDNIYYKNTGTISQELQQTMNFADYKKSILREMHKYQDELETIKKEDNLDKTFVSMIDRRLDLEKETEEKLAGHLDQLKDIMDANDPGKQQKLQQQYSKLVTDARSITQRNATETESLAKALNEKYGQLFDLDESLSYKDYKSGNKYSANANTGTTTANPPPISGGNIPPAPANSTTTPVQNVNNTTPNNTTQLTAGFFAGSWSNEGGLLYLDNNGFSWRWNDGNPTSSGGWRAQNNQMIFYVMNGYSANTEQLFNMYDVTATSFTLQLVRQPSIVYHCYKQ